MIQSFICVNISSENPESLAKFYSETLGIPIVFEGYGNYDGAKIGFIKDAPTICIWDENKWGKYEGIVNLVFKCDHLDKTYKELKDKGVTLEPPFTADWGGRELILHDPVGNIIYLLE